MLGIYLAPDGNTEDQVTYLHQKAELWADAMSRSHARNREEVEKKCGLPYTAQSLLQCVIPSWPPHYHKLTANMLWHQCIKLLCLKRELCQPSRQL
jgi:hypothetical protein